jgi:hypothetical protein
VDTPQKNVVVLQAFAGLFTNTGPSAGQNPPSVADVQTNIQVQAVSGLVTRPGYTVVRFEDE